jgi:hypothetical protein
MSKLGSLPDAFPRTPAPVSEFQSSGQRFLYLPGWNLHEDFYGGDKTLNGATESQFRTSFDGINDDVSFDNPQAESPTTPWLFTIGFRPKALGVAQFLAGQGQLAPPNVGWGLYISNVDNRLYSYGSSDGSAFMWASAPTIGDQSAISLGDFQIASILVTSTVVYTALSGQVNGIAGTGQTAAINVATDFRIGSGPGTWYLNADVYFAELIEGFSAATLNDILAQHRRWLAFKPERPF